MVLCASTSPPESSKGCYWTSRNCSSAGNADIVSVQSNGAGLLLQTGSENRSFPSAGAEGVLPPNFPAADGKGLVGVPAFSGGMADSNRNGGHDQGCQQMSTNSGAESGKPKKTLLVSYLPRCAAEHDLEQAFVRAGISASLSVHVVREAGTSKCFGFVRFPTRDLARAAYESCQDGRIVMKDRDGKPWHIKAAWARVELRNRK